MKKLHLHKETLVQMSDAQVLPVRGLSGEDCPTIASVNANSCFFACRTISIVKF